MHNEGITPGNVYMTPDHEPIRPRSRSSWKTRLAVVTLAVLAAETVTGLTIRFGPFHAANQWGVLIHTALGAGFLAPVLIYTLRHWRQYRTQAVSDVVLLGYFAVAMLAGCLLSGIVVTAQALLATRTSAIWRDVHLLTTLGLLVTGGAQH